MNRITQDAARAIFREVTKAGKGFATTQEIMNAAIQHYIDQQAKEFPVLPELPESTTIMDLDLCGHNVFYPSDMLYYGDQRAAHAREMALSDAKAMGKTLTYQPTDPIDFTAYQEGYMDAITEFYSAIEALKGK